MENISNIDSKRCENKIDQFQNFLLESPVLLEITKYQTLKQ